MSTGTISTNSDGKTVETFSKYVFDYVGGEKATTTDILISADLVTKLKERNMIATPIESITKITNGATTLTVGGQRIAFSFWDAAGNATTTTQTNPIYIYKAYAYEPPHDNSPYNESRWQLKASVNNYNMTVGKLAAYTVNGWSASESYLYGTNRLVTQKQFLGFTWAYKFEANTRLLSEYTDENGFKTAFAYDALMRLKESKSYFADGSVRSTTANTYNYRPANAPISNSKALNNYVNSTTTFTGITDPLSTTQFFDGLGRPIEVSKELYTPNKLHQKSYMTYDALGRQDKGYQPFESGSLDVEAAPSGTAFVYAEYEKSPLSRPIKQYAEDGKFMTTGYGANTANEVRLFSVNTEGGVSTAGYYAANLLYKTTMTNENGKFAYVFKDKSGRVVLTRKVLGTTNVDTYNVYDDYGSLVMVIPPDAIDANNSIKTDLVFTYKYNNKNLLCEKKIPGAERQVFYYNERDLLSLMQDGNMRKVNPNKYLSTEYDQYGRLLRTGFWITATPIIEANNIHYVNWTNLLTENTYYSTGNRLNYQLKFVLNKAGVADKWLWTSFWYNQKGEMYYTGKDNLEGANYVYLEYNTAGKVTLNENYHYGRNWSQYSTSLRSSYDHALRNNDNTFVFWGGSVATPLPRMHLAELSYNYKDQLIEKNIGRNDVVSGSKALQSIDYTYNQRGWLTDINQQPLSYHNQIMTSVKVGKKVFQLYGTDPNPTFSIMPDESSVDLFSESIRYDNPDVNLSNLATPQFNGNISQAVWQVAGREQQAYTYKYDDLDRLLEGEYTDIHDMDGLNAGAPYSTDNKFGEKLTYDLRGNILSLQRNGMIAPGLAGGSVVSGTFGQIDDLTYTYNTQNQVTAITDKANTTKGFKYNDFASDAYRYDRNGNLTKDRNKGIDTIIYNHLNLPQVIQFTGSRSIEFVYDALGAKLRKTVIAPNLAPIVTDYMGGFEYKNGVLEKIHHTEGYVERKADGSFQYNYSLKDHLGNARVTFADLNNNGTIDPNTEINQINHYAPFGLNLDGNWNGASPDAKNKYGYNGQELQSDFGLDWNDYGFRMYDPAIGRFPTIDPLADIYDYQTPYAYAANNPINNIDFMGLGADDKTKDKDGGVLQTVTCTAKRLPAKSAPTKPTLSFLGLSLDPLTKLLPSPKFFNAALSAIKSNINPLHERIEPEDEEEVNGLRAGDGASFIFGIELAVIGAGANGTGNAITIGTFGLSSPITIPVSALGALAVVEGGVIIISSARNMSKPYIVKAKKTSNKSGKEAGSDTPHWSKGEKPNVGEKPKDFARRLMDEKKGPGNWKDGPGTEYNQLKKYAERLLKK